MDRRFRPALAFAAVILVTSILPVPESGGDALPTLVGVALDKWVHAAGYGLLTVLVLRARRPVDTAAVGATVALVGGYGVAIELLQWPVPTRGTSLLDALANTVGAGAGALAWLVVRRAAPSE